jgi:hypothetical protein
MNAPQYGRQPYRALREGIAITTRFSPLMWLFATVTPKIFVNGYQMPVAGWGPVVFPLAPGQYRVHVHTPYFFPQRVGPADYAAIVYPGQFVELEYKAPLFTFSRGALGPPPQRYNGMAVMIGVMAAAVLLIFAVAAIVAVAA